MTIACDIVMLGSSTKDVEKLAGEVRHLFQVLKMLETRFIAMQV